MNNVLIRPALTYASETWTLSQTNKRRLSLFESKVLRCIFGAKQEKETWRKRYSSKLYEAFNEPNIVKYINQQTSIGCTEPDRTRNTSPTQRKHNLNNTHAAA